MPTAILLPPCPYCAQDTLSEDALGRVRCVSNRCHRENRVGGFHGKGRQIFAPLLRAGCDACATERTEGQAHTACHPWEHLQPLAEAIGYTRRLIALGAWVWSPK